MFRIAVLASFLWLTAAQAEDWPQWLGTSREGVWKETGLMEKFPAGGLKPVWTAKVGQGYAGPAVASGRVFVPERVVPADQPKPMGAFDTKTVVKGNEALTCFDEKTGDKLWSHAYPCNYRISYSAGPRCTPTVQGDRVFFLGAMGDLTALDVKKGDVLWKKNFVSDFGANVPVWGFSSHPLADGQQLICLVGGSDGRLVMSLDVKTGAEKWRALSYESGDFGYAPPVIHELMGQRTLLIWHPKALVGLDPVTGKKLWDVPMNVKAALTAPQVRVQGNFIFTTEFYNGSQLVEITTPGPKIVWRSKAKGERPNQTTDLSAIMPTPYWVGDHIYGVCSYGELRCINAKTGERLWSTMKATRGSLTPEAIRTRETPSESQPWAERWSNAFLIPNGNRTVIFNEQGDLIFAKLTPTGYEELDRTNILKPTNRLAGRPVVWMHPAFANGHIYARNDETLVKLDLRK
ncbi:MAG: PQQ-binding-like beta-propeller repeat protein [Fimbriiglobus sp.]